MRDVVESGAQIQAIARRYGQAGGFLFLGRGAQYPIALIDEHLPVVVLVPRGPNYEKVVSNLSEVKARQGKILAIATRGDHDIGTVADDVIMVPDTALELQPLLTVLPLQLLAYHVADVKGTDIDQPRNLAKSVTVE